MKRTLAAAVLFALLAAAPALRAQGIQMFEGTWSQVLAEAQRTGKPIYLDAYASWCGPCKMLKRDVFTDPEVAAYFNANFVSTSIDMEKGEGVELAKKYGVNVYPTHLYFDSNGNLVHRAVGANAMPAFGKVFIGWADDARDPSKQLYAQLARFYGGERDPEFLYLLAVATDEAYMPESKLVSKLYFQTQSDDDILSDRNWEAIGKLVTDIDGREFGMLMKNREKLVAKYGEAEVDARILAITTSALSQAKRTIDRAKKVGPALGDGLAAATTPEQIRTLAQAYLPYYELTGQWNEYASTAVRLVEGANVDDPDMLNSLAWTFYESVDDPAMLKKAEGWASKAIAAKESYEIVDTHAALLFKLKRKKEAMKEAQRAIELAKKEGTDYAGTESLLGKIRAL
jgi:thiol-disulfide isomerase/thioredoxin